MKKIVIVTTLWSSINNWIKPFLNEYSRANIDVTIVCNMDSVYEKTLKEEYPFIHSFPIDFPRGISIYKSIKSIHSLKRFLKHNKFNMIQYSTPNASLYASIASKMAKIPVRLYCQWGMVYVTMSGIKRLCFKQIEKLICKLSTNIQPDSIGNLEFCRKEKLYNDKKSEVIWNGSAKGLDLSKFDITKKTEYSRLIREKYNITENDRVIGFVGRLGKEKGCNELFKAFKILKNQYPTLKMLFVGPLEKEDSIEPELLDYFINCKDIIKTGRVNNVEQYTAAMEVFVLPTYREGFGMGVIEASAMGTPVVVTEYPGPSSAMVDGVTGFAVKVKDVDGLVKKINDLLMDKDLAVKLGNNGRTFVEKSFNQVIFKKKYMENRIKLLGNSV